MDKDVSKIGFGIFIGVVIGLLLTFLIFYLKNAELREQIHPYDNKTIQLENQTLIKENTIGSNCSNMDNKVYLSSSKLNEAIDLLSQAINLSQIKKEYQNQSPKLGNISAGLLSPRVYSGILEPKSFLINNFDPLKQDISNYLTERNVSASIYVENLRNGANFGINEDEGYFPASLNKLPVAILIMQNVEDGKLTMDTMLPIKDHERTDTFGTLYLTKEKELPLRVLMEKMLKDSDNTAFNVLYDNIDRGQLIKLLDYYNIRENIEYPFKRIEYGSYTDLVTPIHLYNIFSSLYLSTTLSAQDSEYILSLLTKTTEFDIKALADIPYTVTIVNKYGEYYTDDDKLFHDCGIMYISQSRVFYCIMMKNVEIEDAKAHMGYFVNHLYNFIINTRARLDNDLKRKESNIVASNVHD